MGIKLDIKVISEGFTIIETRDSISFSLIGSVDGKRITVSNDLNIIEVGALRNKLSAWMNNKRAYDRKKGGT